MTVRGDTGTTKERMNHGKIVGRIAEMTAGGIIVSVGQRDTEHCYLDFLLNNGLLGPEPDGKTRYDTGYKLRALYYRFSTTGNDYNPRGSSQFTSDAQVGDETDLAETLFNNVLRALPRQYKRIVRYVCIEDVVGAFDNQTHELIRRGLDALYGAFRRVER